jgi:hypothetical protein
MEHCRLLDQRDLLENNFSLDQLRTLVNLGGIEVRDTKGNKIDSRVASKRQLCSALAKNLEQVREERAAYIKENCNNTTDISGNDLVDILPSEIITDNKFCFTREDLQTGVKDFVGDKGEPGRNPYLGDVKFTSRFIKSAKTLLLKPAPVNIHEFKTREHYITPDVMEKREVAQLLSVIEDKTPLLPISTILNLNTQDALTLANWLNRIPGFRQLDVSKIKLQGSTPSGSVRELFAQIKQMEKDGLIQPDLMGSYLVNYFS